LQRGPKRRMQHSIWVSDEMLINRMCAFEQESIHTNPWMEIDHLSSRFHSRVSRTKLRELNCVFLDIFTYNVCNDRGNLATTYRGHNISHRLLL
jgi:hypothetical protein